jgi:D-psicose/D-tagatose/L-ribulose 3-epimerase
MNFGVHAALWMRTWGDDVAPYLETAARLGFDAVELSLLGTDAGTARRLRERSRELGLALTCTTGLAPAQDVTSDDPAVRAAGVAALRRALQVTHDLGAELLCGVVYAPWGVRRGDRRGERWARAVDALAAVAGDAASLGVTLGIEAINRYETDLVNTAAQAVALAVAVDHPRVGVLLDTYHLNVEEKRVGDAIRLAGARLVHLHVVENDRGVPGSGHIPWDDVVAALRDIGYDRGATLEMFVQADLDVSADLTVWRPIEADPDEAARAGLAFLRERFR